VRVDFVAFRAYAKAVYEATDEFRGSFILIFIILWVFIK